MKTVLVLFVHTFFDAVFGWALLNSRPNRDSPEEILFLAVPLGMYVETLAVAGLMFVGLKFPSAGLAAALGMTGLAIGVVYRTQQRLPRFSINRPQWYEWALLAAIGEKVLFGVWQLARTHTYFLDALMHWSGRGRALFGEVNWSLDPASPFFMGRHIGNGNYPLLTITWRALSAKLNGEWNEAISRADGLIFFILIVGTVWTAVRRFSKSRWLAAAAAFVVSAVPLEAWHAAAGYSDIAVEAFMVVAVAALLRQEWFMAGIMTAGAVWSKNDTLLLYLPALVLSVFSVGKWRRVALFLAGFATISPWFAFNIVHSLGITPGERQLALHRDAPKLLWDAFMTSPSSGILWAAILPCAIYVGVAMFRDDTGRGLILAFSITVSTIVFLFTSTNAYAFLADEATIHRVLMQFSATAVLIVTYGVWLKMEAGQTVRLAATKRKRRGSVS